MIRAENLSAAVVGIVASLLGSWWLFNRNVRRFKRGEILTKWR